MKGTVELIGKLVRIESRHLLVETACSVGLVHLVDLKLALHLVDEINKHVSVYNVREGFNG